MNLIKINLASFMKTGYLAGIGPEATAEDVIQAWGQPMDNLPADTDGFDYSLSYPPICLWFQKGRIASMGVYCLMDLGLPNVGWEDLSLAQAIPKDQWVEYLAAHGIEYSTSGFDVCVMMRAASGVMAIGTTEVISVVWFNEATAWGRKLAALYTNR